MIKYEDECVGCPSNIGCIGSSCPNMNISHTYCDNCGDEAYLYSFENDGEQLCKRCMEKELDKAWSELTYIEKCEIFDVKEIAI